MELINALRLVAGETIVESKLSNTAKHQLLNFLQHEATEHQVKALLLDGEIINHIDEQAEDIIDARFERLMEEMPELKKEVSGYVGSDLKELMQKPGQGYEKGWVQSKAKPVDLQKTAKRERTRAWQRIHGPSATTRGTMRDIIVGKDNPGGPAGPRTSRWVAKTSKVKS